MTDQEPGFAARGTALAGHLTLSALLAFTLMIIWATTGAGYFWPMWTWLGLGIPLGLHYAIRRAWSAPRGRHRQLAVQAAVSIVIGTAQIVIWVMSGAGLFWPMFPILGLAVAYALHLTLRPPGDPQLAVRVDELTRTRRGALDVQAAQLRRIERDLHDGAQSRLVALSLQLGRAEERLSGQPEVEALVRRAREEATAAIAELRDLRVGSRRRWSRPRCTSLLPSR